VGWAILFLAGGFGLMVLFSTGMIAIVGGADFQALPTSQLLLLQTITGLISFGFLTWLIGHKALRLSWDELRWTPMRDSGNGVALGLVIGVVPAALAILVAIPTAGAAIVRDTTTPGTYLGQLGLTCAILLPAALLEEMMFRGVGQVVLARVFGRVPTIIALSLLFALAHIFNANSTALGLVNIALAGILLGLVFYLPGGIWTAWGAHFAWNATLAAFDAPVSGLPFPIPAINYLPGQPTWLTGGPFGPEGGVLASITVVTAILVTYRRLNHSKESV
jgi:hypothetical protein